MPGSASTTRSVPSFWIKVILAMTLAREAIVLTGLRTAARLAPEDERERRCPLAALLYRAIGNETPAPLTGP
jgi:hypothetical protein